MIAETGDSKPLFDYLGILRRRKLALVLPAIIVFAAFFVLATSLPATYKSKATILIEEQAIPEDYVRSTISNFAAQQVQVISQRVLTTSNISEVVKKFDLYEQSSAESNGSLTEIAKIFRKDMDLNFVSADVIDPRSGKATEVTIAFTLAFKAGDPATAQQVAEELVTLYLNENVRERTDQADSTTKFLNAEAAKLNAELTESEQKLADFKLQNEGSLPEHKAFNLAALERANRESSSVTLRIENLEKSRIELVAEMAQQDPSIPLKLPSGDIVLSDMDRLKSLQAEYRQKVAIYKDNHPDVVRLNREIKALEADLGVEADVGDLRRQLREQLSLLAKLRAKYSDNYHEVQSVRRVIEQLESGIEQAELLGEADEVKTVADNPTYVFLKTKLNTTEGELRSLKERKRQLDSKIDEYETSLKLGPNVERDYQALLRDYDNAKQKYQEIRNKQREAMSVRALEQQQQGQRFVLLEPPVLPRKPISPDRPAIVFLGLVLAIGSGLGLAVVREAMDGAIHGVGDLTAIMGEPPLVAIPYIDNSTDVVQRQRAMTYSLLAAGSGVVLFLFYLHYFFKPLDILFLAALNSLGLN